MSATSGEEVRQQIAQLVRRGTFKPLGRYLPEEHREDRLAEAVALTLTMALRYAARGERLDDALLVHHARLRATDCTRHLVSSKGRGVDALNQGNFIKGRTEVLHLDGVADADGELLGSEGDQQLIGLALNGNPNPADVLASAFDLQGWLAALTDPDRRLLELRASGLTLREIGMQVGLSISRVFARCTQLGLALAAAAELDVSVAKHRRSAI